MLHACRRWSCANCVWSRPPRFTAGRPNAIVAASTAGATVRRGCGAACQRRRISSFASGLIPVLPCSPRIRSPILSSSSPHSSGGRPGWLPAWWCRRSHPFPAAFVRFLIATLALGWFAWRLEGGIPRLRGDEWLTTAAMGFTGIFAYNYFFLNGLQHIPAGRGALVVALNPAIVALAAWAFFGEAMNRLKAIGIVLALCGCLLVVSNGRPQALLAGEMGVGELLIVGCVVCWAFFTFIGRCATRTRSALIANFYSCVFGCAMLGAAAVSEGFFTHLPDYSPKAWSSLFFLGFCGTALSYTWFTEGVHKIGAARAAAFINLVPVSGVLLGALLLGERLGLSVLVGGVVTIAGVILSNRRG
ncbi:MAG: EamA family transporter [Candidatus Dactylopiibacterium carminicum]|uniref:EamA family transporter n=1 Tax=Candidatus Dactylopiibacterium carminicum TaxID=857335 RepID=A0A272EUF5_9RHOO|nr:EamA/RhaT family transporter [Candidatus Dactylopiibacterium carminicum]PAS93725.1 MAG: EamA family transporter [Candidatus Dactylopiibacterium carminicum]